MDSEALVREQLDEGAEIVKELRENDFEVPDAYWYSADDEGHWRLCLVVPDLDARGIRRSYRKVQNVAAKRPQSLFGVDPYDIRLVDLSDPVARAVHAFRSKHGDTSPTKVRDGSIEGQHIDRAFIYPRSMSLK